MNFRDVDVDVDVDVEIEYIHIIQLVHTVYGPAKLNYGPGQPTILNSYYISRPLPLKSTSTKFVSFLFSFARRSLKSPTSYWANLVTSAFLLAYSAASGPT